MNSYIKSLKDEGYTSLREEYYDNLNSFPAIGETKQTNVQDPDMIDNEDQTTNGDDDNETEVEEILLIEANSKESETAGSLSSGDLPTEKSAELNSEEMRSVEDLTTGDLPKESSAENSLKELESAEDISTGDPLKEKLQDP